MAVLVMEPGARGVESLHERRAREPVRRTTERRTVRRSRYAAAWHSKRVRGIFRSRARVASPAL